MQQILLKKISKYNFVNRLFIEGLLRKHNVNTIHNKISAKKSKKGIKITITKIQEV